MRRILTSVATGLAVAGLLVLPGWSKVLAAPAASGVGVVAQNKINDLKGRATTEINNRVASLNTVLTRLSAIKKISDSDRAALTSQIQTEIQTMQGLLTKISADSDLATLRADVQSITKAYRIYWLFIPQVHVMAASDRINETAVSMLNVVSKLQARITAGGTATAGLQTILDDAKAKIADAQTQGQNAVNLVKPLVPDGGNQTVMQSNLTALKQARGDIAVAAKDLRAAWQDFRTIAQQLRALKVSTGSKTATNSSSL